MRVLLLILWCYDAAAAAQQTDVEREIRDVQSQLAAIQQEQQSVYQQFQMLQGLRQEEQAAQNPQVVENSPVYAQDNPPPNYDDIVKEKAARRERIQRYSTDINALFARYQQLEQQKQPLLARLRELTRPQ